MLSNDRNKDIRLSAAKHNIPLYVLAYVYGYTGTTFSKMLNYSFSADDKDWLLSAIKRISKGEDIEIIRSEGIDRKIERKVSRYDRGKLILANRRYNDLFVADHERCEAQAINSVKDEIEEWRANKC